MLASSNINSNRTISRARSPISCIRYRVNIRSRRISRGGTNDGRSSPCSNSCAIQIQPTQHRPGQPGMVRVKVSWLNLVEIFFSIITRQAIRRGTFTSVPDLIAAIRTFIDSWNQRCHPFSWTKTPDEILPHATGGQRTSITRH
jgi:hypothetical protein